MPPLNPHVVGRPPVSRLPGAAGIHVDGEEAKQRLENFVEDIAHDLVAHLRHKPHLDPLSFGRGYSEYATEFHHLLEQLHARMTGKLENLRAGAETALRHVGELIAHDLSHAHQLDSRPYNVVVPADDGSGE